MSIIETLVDLAAHDTPAKKMLDLAVHAIAADVSADECRIYLRRHLGPLTLRASSGSDWALAKAELLADRAVTQLEAIAADTPERSWVAIPLVSRLRCLGAIVVDRDGSKLPFTKTETDHLSVITSQLVDLVEGANLIELLATRDAAHGPLEANPRDHAEQQIIEGVAASPGIAIGVASFRHVFPSGLIRRQVRLGGEATERAHLRDALQKTQTDLLRMQAAAARELGEEEALIFGAHLLLLHDSMLLAGIEEGIKTGLAAAAAVDDAFQEIGRRLRGVADPYIQERIEDVEDLRSRMLGHLLELEAAPTLDTHVVVSPRTSPSVIMELTAQGALGVASELGGVTSHGVLLARALGVPAVTGVSDLLRQVGGGETLILDGDTGRVILRPSPTTLAEYRDRIAAKEESRVRSARLAARPAQTADGVDFKLQANVALGIDLDIARASGAGGVGLYRTEFAYIAREGLPSRDEQVRIYSKAYRAFPNEPLSFRILDLAGDKFLSVTGVRAARSPFHGYRSIRVLFDHPHILRTQAQAFALAAQDRPLRILVPMVSSIEELRRVKALVLSAIRELPSAVSQHEPSFGAMVEVPAAVEIVDDMAAEVDFFSIGTNDLIQYALVIDREDSHLSSPRDVFHPAILRMIRRVISSAHAAGREVSVCGEAAGRAEFAIALLALGVDALSVSPRLIPDLKQRLASVRLRPLVDTIDALLASSEASDIERGLVDALRSHE